MQMPLHKHSRMPPSTALHLMMVISGAVCIEEQGHRTWKTPVRTRTLFQGSPLSSRAALAPLTSTALTRAARAAAGKRRGRCQYSQ